MQKVISVCFLAKRDGKKSDFLVLWILGLKEKIDCCFPSFHSLLNSMFNLEKGWD